MLKFNVQKAGPIWGLAGFILGAALSGTAVSALGHSAPTSPSPSPYKPQAQAPVVKEDATPVFPQRIVVSEIRKDEIEAAINTFAVGAQRKIRKDVASKKYRLVWLTVWDWDTPLQAGDTISILSDDYRRYVTLNRQRTRIAIPEPNSGYIEMRGEATEDGDISISILSGTHPIALPHMAPGQSIKLQIDS